jgi:DNA transposition AAA+ family ATPase
MKETPLTEYLDNPNNSQEALAVRIGYRQSAISNMLKAKRNISVVEHDNGTVELVETKVIGSKKTA